MSTTIRINGRTVVVDKRTISTNDVERLTLLRSPSVTYRFARTGAKGILTDGDVLAVADDLEIFAVVTGAA